MPIVGGTGDFFGAHGELEITSQSGNEFDGKNRYDVYYCAAGRMVGMGITMFMVAFASLFAM